MTRIVRIVKEMAKIYTRERVSRSAAALAYFLTISIFPMFICVSALLGSLNIDQEGFFDIWSGIIPDQAIGIIGDFLAYVGNNKSSAMLVVGVTVMLTSSAAAFRTITNIMGDIQGKKRFAGIFGEIFNFILSLSFLAVIYASALVVVTGEWFLRFLERYFVIANAVSIWRWTRFILLFFLLFGVVFGIYSISAPKGVKRRRRLPGAAIAAMLLVFVSIIFSRLISASAKYAIVYGSLASMIILMTWLYTCGIILIMGNVLNICAARDYTPKIREHA